MVRPHPLRSVKALPQLPKLSPLTITCRADLPSQQDKQAIAESPRSVDDIWMNEGRMCSPSSFDYFPDFDGDWTDMHHVSRNPSIVDGPPQDLLPKIRGAIKRRSIQGAQEDMWTRIDSGRILPDDFPAPPRSEVKKFARKPLPSVPASTYVNRVQKHDADPRKLAKRVPVDKPDVHLHWEGAKACRASIQIAQQDGELAEQPTAVNQTAPVPMTWYNRNRRRATFDEKGMIYHCRGSPYN